jgi:hypothetical protein
MRLEMSDNLEIAGLCDDTTAPIDMAIPKQMGMPDRIPRQGKHQFEIAQVAVTMVRIIIGGCCTWLRTNRGKDSRGQLGQNHVRIIDIDGGQGFPGIVSSAKGSMA